jgi:hypothetical protein
MRTILLASLWSATAIVTFAQTTLEPDDLRFRYGIKIGVQVLDSFNVAPGFNAEDSRGVFGGVLDMRINDYFGGEVDVLYRHFRFDALLPGTLPVNASISTNRAHAFDFPFLFKWNPLGRRTVTPYVDSGVAFRYINGNELRRFFGGNDLQTESTTALAQVSSFNVGWVIGGGLVFDHSESVRLTPEVRYTVWGRDNFNAPSTLPGFGGTFSSNNNQLEVLLSITF